MKIAIIYFSATKVTEIYSNIIEKELLKNHCSVSKINITSYSSRKKYIDIDYFDAFIFGFPVFADFAPSVINNWIPCLNGQNKKCSMFFTYGGRTASLSHYHTKKLLEKANFNVQLSAEFLGRHTFNVGGWKVLPDRPNKADFKVAEEFALISINKFRVKNNEKLILQRPYGYDLLLEVYLSKERKWTNPIRVTDECSMCLICENECPSQAIEALIGKSDPGKCIECMHCIYICPDQVLKIDERMKNTYFDYLNHWELTEEMMNKKQSKIII